MANIKFPRKEFEDEIPITKETLEKIPLFGTPLESLTDDEIEVEIFPNRPDLLSMQGYLRSFKAFLGESEPKRYRAIKSGEKLIVDKSLPKQWPYALACIIKGLSLDDEKIKEIITIQEKLGATVMRKRRKGGIGLYPLEGIKFPIHFKGLLPENISFQPLDFPKEITGRQILQKHPKGKEYSHICQDWNKLPVFVDSRKEIMSMPPIINSNNLGKIDEKTKNIFLEVTGTDLSLMEGAITIIATALADMGGKIYSIECIQQSGDKVIVPNLEFGKNIINLENANKLLGLELKESDLSGLLGKMGHEYKNGKVLTPAWRIDILHEVDIIKDVAIAYGYENFVPEIPSVTTVGREAKESKIKSKLSEILVGLGLIEFSSYHLIKQSEVEKNSGGKIEIQDSKTEYKFLRNNLLIPTLRILAENKDNEYPQNTFEIGKVFSLDEKAETGVGEEESLLISLSPGNFTEIKQTLDYLMKQLGLEFKLEEAVHEGLIEGRTAEIKMGDERVGYIGEVHPKTLRASNIKMPLAVLEISLERVFEEIK